ncbi:MAG: DUF4349 domain-containing protein [Chloroflexi bacterium]|nr:DUF4349 domain-containing protein [Chloroflexota bacterium]
MSRTMKAAVVLAAVLVIGLLAAACGGGGSGEARDDGDALTKQASGLGGAFDTGESTSAPAAGAVPAPAIAPAAPGVTSGSVEGSSASSIEFADRKVISTASLTVEVEDVQGAVAQVRAISESFGGFVEQLSVSGDDERQQATVTVRVPQDQFLDALDGIEALGKLRNENIGSEDVTERFIDLEARLKSSLREEQSLLSLLERADSVADVLTIERELSRVRSDIERYQGQLNFLERRVALATITVFLHQPDSQASVPPSATLTVEVSDVTETISRVKALVASLEGELDRVFISTRDGVERGEIVLRVLSRDFGKILPSIEGQGEVQSKEVSEGSGDPGPEDEEPDAPISVTFIEKDGSSSVGLIIAITAPIGGVALAVVLGIGFLLAYRYGRRKGRGV